nr:sensor histidine kinase [uncultured Duganella sp.]
MRSELEDAREAERARIARELHDEVGQGLLVLRMDLVRLQRLLGGSTRAAQALLQVAFERVDASLTSVRMIINDLHPVVLDQGLADACAWQVRQFRQRTGLSCKLLVTGAAAELDSRCKNALFRILQESLNNIARHARAANVTVALALDARQLELTVIDDGIGLPEPANAHPASHGIKGMRERTQMLGGVFRIASVPTGGTVLHVSVPLARERRQRGDDRRR